MALTDQVPFVADGVPVHSDRSIVPPSRGRVTRWLTASGAIGACAAGLGVLYLVDPNSAANPYPRCLLKVLTGLDCPGCGGTRAMYALLHGDVVGAIDHSIVVFAVVPILVYLVVRYALDQLGVSLPAPRAKPWMGWVAAIFLIVFSVVRNIPGQPLFFLNSELA